MKLHELKPYYGSKTKRKIVGRGLGSGHGETSTRGSKGQKSRSGDGKMPGFEGGQMPLMRRIPKRGFRNEVFRKDYLIFSLGWLEQKFSNVDEITPQLLIDGGYAKKNRAVKILSDGEIKRPLKIKAHAFSKGAIEKIKKANGQFEIIK